MERTISGMVGQGSVGHNTRTFIAKNVDAERSIYNMEFCHEDLKDVYHKLFDDALDRYNAKQKRSDRMIDDYYKKIEMGKQEKLFHEVIFQIGNKDDTNARSEDGQLVKEVLAEFMEDFQKRNPNLYVFSAHLHMVEETPHVHIDFVPFVQGSRRGLDTRVSLKGALAAQGFKGGTREATEWHQWIESEKNVLASVMERHGIKWLQKGTHNKHLSVLNFEKQEREKEVAELDSRIEKSEAEVKKAEQDKAKLQADNQKLAQEQEKLRKEIEAMAGSKKKMEKNLWMYDEDERWQLPEVGVMQTARAYRDKSSLPLVNRYRDRVKELTVMCIDLAGQAEKYKERVKKLEGDVKWFRGEIGKKEDAMKQVQEKVDDLERVKRYVGADKVQKIIESVKVAEKQEIEQKILQKKYSKDMFR